MAGLFGLVLLNAGCARPDMWTDFTSVSAGMPNDGRLRRPAKLPTRGTGYYVPGKWRERGRHYGTDELVAAIQRAAEQVRGKDWRVKLGVGDLSQKEGKKIRFHSSHQSGRDVDLIFYHTNDQRRPIKPPEQTMIHFGIDGEPFVPEGQTAAEAYEGQDDWASRRFDDKRNWALVRALLSDPAIRVQWIFVSSALRDRLLRYAKRHDEPRWVIEYARVVMRQPLGAAPHDDHFHVRVYCARADRIYGCVDRSPVWQHEKKAFKYLGPERYQPELQAELRRPLPLFFPHG